MIFFKIHPIIDYLKQMESDLRENFPFKKDKFSKGWYSEQYIDVNHKYMLVSKPIDNDTELFNGKTYSDLSYYSMPSNLFEIAPETIFVYKNQFMDFSVISEIIDNLNHLLRGNYKNKILKNSRLVRKSFCKLSGEDTPFLILLYIFRNFLPIIISPICIELKELKLAIQRYDELKVFYNQEKMNLKKIHTILEDILKKNFFNKIRYKKIYILDENKTMG